MAAPDLFTYRGQALALNRGFEYRDHIGGREAGLTVLAFLAGAYRHSSEEEWRERIRDGEVFVDGAAVEPEEVLRAGQNLSWRRPPWEEPRVPLTYAVLYEDGDLLGVAKPGGLPTVPAGGFLEHTLLTIVRKAYPEATPVHRLGRGTSGIVLFARTRRARSVLCAALRQKEVLKDYRALASGLPYEDEFSIEARIGPVPHPRLGSVHAASQAGKEAVSRVKVLERRAGAALVSVGIETGRPHQIRIHLAAVGHPLVGDPLFAPGGGIREGEAALPGDGGYRLHAERILFPHPTRSSRIEIFCSPPPELRVGFTADSVLRP